MIYAPFGILDKAIPIKDIIRFLVENKGDLKIGKHQICGDEIYAVVMEYETKNFEDAVLESHKKYIDLQILLRGEEKIFVSPVDKLEVLSEDLDKDLILYHKPAKFAGEFVLKPDMFAVFTPFDAHCTQVKITDHITVKKVVFKILRKHLEGQGII